MLEFVHEHWMDCHTLSRASRQPNESDMSMLTMQTLSSQLFTLPPDIDPNLELIYNVQFHGRWQLDGPIEQRYTTYWCGSSVFFQTTSKSVTIEIGSLTRSRKNYHNVMWKFGSASVVRTALVNRRRSLKITPSDGRGGEALRDVEVMLCGWGATLQILDIQAVCTTLTLHWKLITRVWSVRWTVN